MRRERGKGRELAAFADDKKSLAFESGVDAFLGIVAGGADVDYPLIGRINLDPLLTGQHPGCQDQKKSSLYIFFYGYLRAGRLRTQKTNTRLVILPQC